MNTEPFDIAIVGSGYGGSVMAARLSGTHRVLLVERGRRWSPDEFPKSVRGLARLYMGADKHGRGLWAMRIGRGVGAAHVSGYGGASLVNYGITVQPEDHAFDGWPVSGRELQPFYDRALEVLAPTPNPIADSLGDKAFFDRLEPGARHDISNTIDWSLCTNCGDCVLGCRLGAKRSLDTTYLALAEERGAEVRTGTTLLGFAPSDGGWELELGPTGTANPEPERVRARQLVISTGTFGTLDLLLRHRDRLALSPRFGEGMSMNGDGAAFLFNTPHDLGSESGAPISTMVRLHLDEGPGPKRTLTVMSGRIPKAIMGASGLLMAALGEVFGRNAGPTDGVAARARRRLRDLLGPRRGGALSHTLMYKLDGQDAAAGRLGTDSLGRAVVDWPDYQADPIMEFARRKLQDWAGRVGGRLVPDLGAWPGMRSFGVHALGGCGMGQDWSSGVTDSFGRVFAPDGGVYPGLRIVDASIVPGALGVPTSLTVAALAERSAAQLLAELAL